MIVRIVALVLLTAAIGHAADNSLDAKLVGA